MNNRKRIACSLLAVPILGMTLGMFASPVRAQQSTAPPKKPSAVWHVRSRAKKAPPVSPKKVSNAVPELVIAGRVVLRLNARAGGMTPQARAYELSQRIGPILTMPNLAASDVQIRQLHTGGVASIYVRDQILVTVDKNLAAANNVSIETLAGRWAQNLRETLPRVNIAMRMGDSTSHSGSSSMPAWDSPASTVIPEP